MNASDENKLRYPLALFLCAVIIVGWSFLFPPETPKTVDTDSELESNTETKELPPLEVKEDLEATPVAEQPNGVSQSDSKKNGNGADFVDNPLATLSIDSQTPALEEEGVSSIEPSASATKERQFSLSNSAIQVLLSTKNSAIKSVRVKNRADGQSIEWSQDNLVSPDFESGGQPGYETGKMVFNVQNEDLLFLTSHADLFFDVLQADKKQITFSINLPTRDREVTIQKIYRLTDDPNKLELKISVFDANDRTPLSLPYFLLNGSSLGDESSKEKGAFDILTLSYQLEDENEEMLSPSFFGADDTFATYDGAFDWMSIDNRFYAKVLEGQQAEKLLFGRKQLKSDEKVVDYLFSALYVNPNSANTQSFNWYFIPKNRALLDKYFDEERKYFFSLFHQFSFMRILSSMMYWVLNLINNTVVSYGISILILTFLIKVATFPLTQKSINSMRRMQELAPKVEAIKSKNKGNSQRINQEMMALYQREKVSPLGGCLPMAIPIPIFIALYSLFQNMVELRGESFLWIKDLAEPDTIAYLGFSIPFLGSGIKVLPIIMTAVSLFQALLPSKFGANTPENPQMKGMKYFFPILFFFICWNLPSGLVLYWTAQNFLSLLQSMIFRPRKGKVAN